MKSILIQNTSDKFIQSLLDSSVDDTIMIDIVVNNNLYSVFAKHKPEYCIFSHKYINEEILQFCEDYCLNTKIYLYYSDGQVSNAVPKNCISIGHNDTYGISIPDNITNIRAIDNDVIRNDKFIEERMVYYAEHKELTPYIVELLYPQTSLKINIFDAIGFYHYQNLGFLSEADKIDILSKSKYYLYSDKANSYINEAILSGCIPISVQSVISNNYKNILLPDKPECITYNQFLIDRIIV